MMWKVNLEALSDMSNSGPTGMWSMQDLHSSRMMGMKREAKLIPIDLTNTCHLWTLMGVVKMYSDV